MLLKKRIKLFYYFRLLAQTTLRKMHCHQVIYLETILPQGKQTFQGNKVKISKQTKIIKIKQIKFQIYVYCLQIFR